MVPWFWSNVSVGCHMFLFGLALPNGTLTFDPDSDHDPDRHVRTYAVRGCRGAKSVALTPK